MKEKRFAAKVILIWKLRQQRAAMRAQGTVDTSAVQTALKAACAELVK
jgi:hypothetical protein